MDCTQRIFSEDVVVNNIKEEIGYLGICGKTHPIKIGPNKIGRDAGCCDIVINHASLSRQHAVINVLSATNFMLMDLGSVNKTKLGIKILQPYLPQNLKHGDTVQFGEVFGVFLLTKLDDELPMTQAFTEVPDTPVQNRPHLLQRLQVTAIPESPELNTSEDDSFILSSQQQGNSFHRPNKNVIRQKKTMEPASHKSKDDSNDSIFWNASTQSPSIHFNLEESDTSIEEGRKKSTGKVVNREKVDLKTIEVKGKENVENIHEALTQLPSPSAGATHLSIYGMDTQLLNQDMVKINVAGDIRLSDVENINIHEQNTQLDIIPLKKCIQNATSLTASTSIHEAETQEFVVGKKIYLNDIHEAQTQDYMGNDSTDNIEKNMSHQKLIQNNIDSIANVNIHEAATQKIEDEEKNDLNRERISLRAVPQNVLDQKTIDITKKTALNDVELKEFADEDTVILDNSTAKDNVSPTVEVSYQNRCTKTIEKTPVQNLNEGNNRVASESDDEIIFDEFESQGFGNKEECSQAMPLDDINENTFQRRSDSVVKQSPEKKNIISEHNLENKKYESNKSDIYVDSDCSTDCEDLDFLPTKEKTTDVVIGEENSTDCEEQSDKDKDEVIWDDNEKTILVPETPENLRSSERKPDILDLTEVPTQIINKPDEIIVKPFCAKGSRAGSSESVASFHSDDISDALTQVLPDALPLPECPTQKIEDCSPVPKIIAKSTNAFKIPISSTPLNIKKKSVNKEKSTISPIHFDTGLAQKNAGVDIFYSNTQELVDDLLTQKEDSIGDMSNINPNTPKVSDREQKKTEFCKTNENIDSCVTPLERQCYNNTQDILADLLTQKVPEENQKHINRTNITGNKLADKISQYSNDISDVESQDVDLLSLSKSSVPAGAVRSEISSVDKMMNGEEDDDEIIPSSQENDSIDENMRFPGINKHFSVQQNNAELSQKDSSSSKGVAANKGSIGVNDFNEFHKIPTPLIKISTPKKSAKFSSDTSDNDNTPTKRRRQPKMGVLDVELPDSQEILRHVSRLPNCTIDETSSDSDSNLENENTPVVYRRKVPTKRKKINVDEPKNVRLPLPTRVITRKRSPTEKLSANTKLKSIITNKVLQVEGDENPLEYVNADIINENLKRLSNERRKKTSIENFVSGDDIKMNKRNKNKTKKDVKESSATEECDADTAVQHTEKPNSLTTGKYQINKDEKCSNKTVGKKRNSKNEMKTEKQSKQRTTRKTSEDVNLQQIKSSDGSEFSTGQYHNLRTVSKGPELGTESKGKKSSHSLKSQIDSNEKKVQSKRTSKRTTQATEKEKNLNQVTETKDVTELEEKSKEIRPRSKRHKKTENSQSSRETKQSDRSKNSQEETFQYRTRNNKDIKQKETSEHSLDKSNTSEEDIIVQRTRTKRDVRSKESTKTKLIETNSSQDKIINKRTRNTKDRKERKEMSNYKLDDSDSSEEDIPSLNSKHVKNSKISKPRSIESNSSQREIIVQQTYSIKIQSETQNDVTSRKTGNRMDTRANLPSAIDEISSTRNEKSKRLAPKGKQSVKEQPLKIKKVESSSVLNQVSPHNTRKRPLTPAPIVEERSTPKKMRRTEDLNSQNSPSIARIGTPSRLSLRPKQNVMFTAFTDPKMEAIVKKLGANIVSDALACTVLVTQHIKRTVKLLCAIGLGRPIVGPSWIQACQNANTLVDPWQYLLRDADAEKRFKFTLVKTLRGARNFLAGKVLSATPSILPTPPEMQSIVECSGGSWCDPFKGGPEAWLCLSTAADSHLWPALRTRGATVLSVEAVLSGVLQQTLHVQPHILK